MFPVMVAHMRDNVHRGGEFAALPTSHLVLYTRMGGASGTLTTVNDAGTTRIQKWSDESGFGRHWSTGVNGSTTTLPEYRTNQTPTGQPAAWFSGSGHWMGQWSWSGMPSEFTLFVVARAGSAASASNGALVAGGTAATAPLYPFSDAHVYDSFGQATRPDVGNPDDVYVPAAGGGSFALSRWHVWSVRRSKSDGAAQQNRPPTGDDIGHWTTFDGKVVPDEVPGYTYVNDHPDSTGTSYLVLSTNNDNGTFTFSPFTVPSGSIIASVRVLYYDRDNTAGANSIGPVLKIGGTYYTGSEHGPSFASYNLRTDIFSTNPATGINWTPDDVNGTGPRPLQAFGLYSTDATNFAIRVASLQLQVNYADTWDAVFNGVMFFRSSPALASGWRAELQLGSGSATAPFSGAIAAFALYDVYLSGSDHSNVFKILSSSYIG